MNDLILYDQNRIEISQTKKDDLVTALRDIMLNCCQIKGHAAGNDISVSAFQLADFIMKNYSKYTVNELSNILQNGYALNGDEYSIVSVSNCLTIIRKYDESIYNRTKLEEARKKEMQGLEISPEIDFKVKCYNSFKNAKLDYEANRVTDFKINFVYHPAYQHVFNVVDNSINKTKEIRKELWEDVKRYISECRNSSEKEEKELNDTLIALCFEVSDEKTIRENSLKGRLFHLWAIENFNMKTSTKNNQSSLISQILNKK
jgi:hypothetical protein